MLEALVLWVAYAIVNGEPMPKMFPSEEICLEAVQNARNHGLAASDCVKVSLPAPKIATL